MHYRVLPKRSSIDKFNRDGAGFYLPEKTIFVKLKPDLKPPPPSQPPPSKKMSTGRDFQRIRPELAAI